MRRVQGNDLPAVNPSWRLPRLPILLVALAAAGAAVAQQAQSPGAADSKYGSSTTSYRVINLSPGLLATIPDINARGQVSFSIQVPGGYTGYFYNGSAVQNIGNLGGTEVLANDLNDAGQIAGSSTTGLGVEHAFVWSPGSGILDIGLGGASGGYSEALAINNRGVATGIFPQGGFVAFRWSAASGIESLGAFVPGGEASSFGTALNDAGLIAGASNTPGNQRHAFAWTRSTGLVDITTLPSLDALPVAVGAKGEVAGNRLPTIDSPAYRPFLWTSATGMVDLGTGGGIGAGVLSMTPGLHIAGLILRADDTQRAMSWTRSTGIRDIGTLGGVSSRAFDVNAKGQIVGFAENKAGARHAFVWTAKGGMRDLNKYLRHAPPGLVLDDALAINDSGAIVATSNAGLVLLRPDDGRKCGHVLGPVVAPALIKVGQPLQASLAFVDADRVGTRSVSWSWGDGSAAQAGKLSESAGAGQTSASHSFAAPGIYQVAATVVDRNGRSTTVSHQVVVTAASGSTVAGAGAVVSPAGAFSKAPLYAGKASFRLIAPAAATTQAQGSPARLQFDLPGLNFRSQDVRPLGLQGGQHVFEGSGTVRGAGSYKFRLSTAATVPGKDGGRFALKIWHTDPASKAEVVDYDNARVSTAPQAARVTDGNIVLQ